MNAIDLVRKAFDWGPVLFGIGFLAPLIAQSLDAASISAPMGLSSIQLGLVIGATTGLVAKFRGTWV